MTRRHFEMLAASIRENMNLFAGYMGQKTYAEHLATLLSEENPRFDRARFLAACGTDD